MKNTKVIWALIVIGSLAIGAAVVGITWSVLSYQWKAKHAVNMVEHTPIEVTIEPTIEPTVEPTIAPTPEPTEALKQKATLMFTGDLMVHDYQYEAAYDSSTGEYDFSNNFPYVQEYLEEADYTVGNLETTLAGKERGYSSYPTFNTPDSFLDAIKEAGYDLLTTANNHCVDKGEDAMKRTIKKVKKYGFDQIGTYASKKDSKEILVRDINGIKIAFLSCTYGTNGMPVAHDYNVQLLNDDFYHKIKEARTMADFVIALPHNGTEYQLEPSEIYKEQYKKMLQAGADAVIAGHPHVLQPVEYKTITEEDGTKRTGFIAYSLGNFISSQATHPRDAGVMLKMVVEKQAKAVSIEKITVIPTWCRFTDASGRRNFTVFSVYDVLHMDAKERNRMFRSKDYARIQQVQVESTKMLLGKAVSVENSKKKYKIKKKK